MAQHRLPRGVYVTVRRDPDGIWRGELRFNLTDGGTGFRVSGTDEGTGGGPGAALQRAVTTANALTSNPVIANMLPPGTVAAISAVRTLARAAKRGKLGLHINGKPLYKHFSGVLGKLAKALHGDKKKGSPSLSGGPPLQLVDGRRGGIDV
ncbi:MAG: hypothetical protein ACTHU0_39220 [Kofleriaceae bacterium]